MFTPTQALLIAAVFFVAAGFQSITGFGFGLLCTSTLFLFFDPKQMVLLLVVPSMLALLTSFVQVRKNVPWDRLKGYIVWALLGIPLGVLMLRFSPDRVLKGVMAVLLLYTLFHKTYLRRLTFLQWTPLSGILAGVGSGALGTAGPAVVSWVHSKDWPFNERVAATLAIFVMSNFVRAVIYWFRGFYGDGKLLYLSALFFPALILGALAGGHLARRMSDRAAERLVRPVIIVLAVMMIRDALF